MPDLQRGAAVALLLSGRSTIGAAAILGVRRGFILIRHTRLPVVVFDRGTKESLVKIRNEPRTK